MGIQPALLLLVERMKQSALTIRQRRQIFIRNSEKFIDRRSTFVTTGKKKSWMSCKNSSIDCISIAQIRWNTKRLFNLNTGIFSRSELKKLNTCSRRLIHSLIFRKNTMLNILYANSKYETFKCIGIIKQFLNYIF